MIVLAIKTDNPQAELHLYRDGAVLGQEIWQAHRELSATIHLRIEQLLAAHNLTFADVDGLVVFEGPGSFTGLRIGFSVANALAVSLERPIKAAGGDAWIQEGLTGLTSVKPGIPVEPVYGAAAATTPAKK